MLEAVDVTKKFKRPNSKGFIYPLAGASLFVDDGERVGIFGKSGQGKSTFANIVCGLLKPDDGNVYLDEFPLYGKRGGYDLNLGKKIQLIPQQPYLSFDPMQKVGNAVVEALISSKNAMGRHEANMLAKSLFERVSLEKALFDRLPAQLSGGQMQRVAIARALAVTPEIIISDESTAMLDTVSQAQILDIYRRLADDGISVIAISHDVGLINSFADRCYRLSDGQFELINMKEPQ